MRSRRNAGFASKGYRVRALSLLVREGARARSSTEAVAVLNAAMMTAQVLYAPAREKNHECSFYLTVPLRRLAEGASVADVAASIGAGLSRAALSPASSTMRPSI